MPETDREARILEVKHLIDRGEYQIDPVSIAASVVDEHLTAGNATPDSSPQDSAEPLANVAAS
jgi:Anti-sigma-28 factor, FlgM